MANAKTTEIDDAIGREPYSTATTSSTKPTSPMAASALKNPRNGGRRSGQRGWSGSSDYPVVNGAPPKCIKHAIVAKITKPRTTTRTTAVRLA